MIWPDAALFERIKSYPKSAVLVPASRMEFRWPSGDLKLRVVRAGPPEFAGF